MASNQQVLYTIYRPLASSWFLALTGPDGGLWSQSIRREGMGHYLSRGVCRLVKINRRYS